MSSIKARRGGVRGNRYGDNCSREQESIGSTGIDGLNQLASMQVWNRDKKEPERVLAAVDMIAEFAPKNALETLLAVQMFGVHEAALLFLQRATIPGQTFEGSGGGVLWATRLMRLFNEQVELMLKLKGKASEQKVTVEHVHVPFRRSRNSCAHHLDRPAPDVSME